MIAQPSRLATLLTYGGTLPFLAGAVAALFAWHSVDLARITALYGAVIVSFLCGIHWAVYMFFSASCPRNLLLTSNATALVAWVSLLLNSQGTALMLQIACLLFLLHLDQALNRAGILPPWFYALRRNATVIVVSLLALIACRS